MAKTLIIRKQAQREIDVAVAGYAEVRPELANRFYRDLLDVFLLMQQYPEMYEIVLPRIRRAVMHDFPYSVFYVVGKQNLSVLALLHQAASPKKWPK